MTLLCPRLLPAPPLALVAPQELAAASAAEAAGTRAQCHETSAPPPAGRRLQGSSSSKSSSPLMIIITVTLMTTHDHQHHHHFTFIIVTWHAQLKPWCCSVIKHPEYLTFKYACLLLNASHVVMRLLKLSTFFYSVKRSTAELTPLWVVREVL
jgi:hypothetical protein